MLKNIPLWWLIVLAWLLAIFGSNFWQFNVMELFATLAILFTAGIAISRWRKGKRKQDILISFPDNWSARYDKDKNIVRFDTSANVLIPLSQIPKGVSELQIQIKVRLDGDIKKVSEKRKIPISGLDLLEPGKEGSQS